MRTVLQVAGMLLVLSALLGCQQMERNMDEFVENAEYTTPDLQEIPDGTYTGKQRVGIVNVKLRVTITDGRIEAIDLLKHFNGQGEDAEAIIDDVIAAQSVEVDTISGATYSSTAILKAIENALTLE